MGGDGDTLEYLVVLTLLSPVAMQHWVESEPTLNQLKADHAAGRKERVAFWRRSTRRKTLSIERPLSKSRNVRNGQAEYNG
ncbi:hypothetical protein GCM10023156_43120 [Novipirellula rosea]|uniref:Uncharacterized protein n=1 Tax=Novipirellula rosea TaxID=1031540 RepID=A0ABP8N7A0_9BACT